MTEAYQKQLTELGVETPIKALYAFPKHTIFMEKHAYMPEMREGVFEGVISSKVAVIRKGRLQFTRFSIDTNGYTLPIIAFNQPYLQKTISLGKTVVVVVKQSKNNFVASKVYQKNLDAIENESHYHLLKGMRQQKYRAYIDMCLATLSIENFLPQSLHDTYKLIPRSQAFSWMHHPKDEQQRSHALRYFKYEEAFLFQLNLQIRKQGFKHEQLMAEKIIDDDYLAEIIAELPFVLTDAQQKVLKEVKEDMKSHAVMHRLVQGDVGSGKTIVAMLAALMQIKAGYQVAFLAPTTVLAKQHFKNMLHFLEKEHVVVAYLRSQMKKKERDEVIRALGEGRIDFIVGTHALLVDDVQFKNIGLAIVDEQQRFGVEQRKKMRHKGKDVEMLYMTATPIPRTLAMSVFGDLDVSTIDQLPAGRQAIDTKVVQKKSWKKVEEAIIATWMRKEQIYVVCPLIEESENSEHANLIEVFETLSKNMPKDMHLGMLHGKQSNEEKQAVLQDFSENKIDVLVSTTVIEVGVDVPNATLMVIVDAQQFGLSQLHQLRGRIGRSHLAATCLLVSNSQSERLTLMEQSQDGFFLSQEDLRLRGPGDFFGEKQSGVPTFKVLNLVDDFSVLDCARVDVEKLLSDSEYLKKQPKIHAYIQKKKAEITEYLA